MFKKVLFTLLFGLPLIAMAQSESQTSIDEATLRQLLQQKIRTVQTFALNPMIIEPVRAQNEQKLTMEEIKSRDEAWVSSDRATPFKRSLENSKLGRFLKRNVEANPAFTEVFVTDNQGANVAVSPITSDYWQGDEEKWSNVFNDVDSRLYIGPVEFDESTGSESVQLSVPIIDDEETIGVLMVGVSLSYLQGQQ